MRFLPMKGHDQLIWRVGLNGGRCYAVDLVIEGTKVAWRDPHDYSWWVKDIGDVDPLQEIQIDNGEPVAVKEQP